ncbi:hypothetical protein, partial [Bartonella bacilliformis]|uniref:hypothetical protein n=1 Tax=Bartonella bacilliformis TaxID=774 RepID=UPI0039E37997
MKKHAHSVKTPQQKKQDVTHSKQNVAQSLKKTGKSSQNPGKSSQNLGSLKTQAIAIETSNPYFQPAYKESSRNPRTIIAIADAYSRPIALLYAKGHISRAQYKAAEHFYKYWYQIQGQAHMGFDFTRQKVDGNPPYQGKIESQIEAAKQLREIKIQLGILGYALVEQVVGYGLSIKELNPVKRKQNSLADHLRDCLDLMALHWGYVKAKSL